MTDELSAIDFAREFVPNILSREKRATTRLLRAEPHLQQLCTAGLRARATYGAVAGEGGHSFAVVRIRAVEWTTVGQLPLNDELARTEGLESGMALQALIRRLYPDAADDDALAVLHFDVEEAGSAAV